MPALEKETFETATAPLRRELLAHCYRMSGSLNEAEDLVQETYLRAWRAFEQFERRSSVRTWMYRIATNVCLTELDRRRRRPLPSAFSPASADPYAPPLPAPAGARFVEPLPDRLVIDPTADPSDVVEARHGLRLALVAALQVLPPRQRAAFLLADTLGLPVQRVAPDIGVSVAAAKSLVQRARARLARESFSDDEIADPSDPGARDVLDRYIAAFEASDVAEIERLLAADAAIEMTGTTTWFSGKATCLPFIAAQAIGRRGDWRLFPTAANGQPAATAYHLDGDGYSPFAVVVLATTRTHITRITLFDDLAVFARFDESGALRPG